MGLEKVGHQCSSRYSQELIIASTAMIINVLEQHYLGKSLMLLFSQYPLLHLTLA